MILGKSGRRSRRKSAAPAPRTTPANDPPETFRALLNHNRDVGLLTTSSMFWAAAAFAQDDQPVPVAPEIVTVMPVDGL